jgi:DNA invertase Pin-like site-specific DNA recombinase
MSQPRFVELIRVSSVGQAERDTPEDQRRALERLSRSRPGRLVERIDHGARGLSGAADLNQRPDLQRLAELSRSKAFDELRVRHLDRLTRHTDPRERFAIFGMVADAGAVIVDAGGSVIDPKSEMGEVFYFLQTWGSAQERKKIVERTVEARRRLSASGRPMTTIPYGRTFDYETGTWGIDEERIAVYRRIFRETIAGVSLHQLAAKLNREGISAPKGGPWEASSLRRMLRNGSAVGRMTSYGHPIACPPVVDEVTQRRALAAMVRGRVGSGPRAKHSALLRRIATCAVCGSTMHVHPGNTRVRPVLYYRCAKAKPKTCEARTYHPVAEVDAAFVDALRAALEDPERLLRAATRKPTAGTAEEDAERARRELARLEQREENLVRMRSQGEVRDEMFRRQAAEIARLRNDATGRLAAAEAALDASGNAQDRARDVAAAIESIRRRITRATPQDWRALVERLFPRQPGTWIRLHPDGRVETSGILRLWRP